jgi:hypothetical protein
MHVDTISIPPNLDEAVTSLLEMKIKERERDNSQCKTWIASQGALGLTL